MATIRAIAFPLTLDGNNLATSVDSDVVRNAIMHVLSIQPGEYLTRPFYGTPSRVFDSITDITEIVQDAESRLRNQVGADFPTASFRVSGAMGESGVLDLKIEWELDGLNQPTIVLKLG